ncbi:MAG TPA: carboxymuconolactone decarboxylase family protein [Tepidisphaeraceae bacterium]|jgi:uncharacterized peroxidase-related enzyme|nr:carboxymuconolactone decarboxylase family protein [Tepidisphaeraceae bacterium]
MSRLTLIDPATATGAAKDVLEATKATFGATPNMVRAMANSPVVAKVFLDAFKTLGGGVLNGQEREAIALAVAERNGCDYCLSAHTAIGKMHRMSDAQLTGARHGQTGDGKLDALVTLARQLVERRGHLSDADLTTARAAGLTDAHVAEVVAHVAIAFYTNYFNHVAQPEIDFPVVRAG